MDTRRLPLVLVLLLLPVPAAADRHKVERAAGFSSGSVTFRYSEALRVWDKPDRNPNGKRGQESLFVFGEVGLHVAGEGSGRTLEDFSLGGRYRTCGECRIEPFGNLMLSRQRPSRPEGINADTDFDDGFAWAGGVGLGFDVELDVDKVNGWVKLVRFQIDLLESSANPGFDHHGRVTIGIVFRKESDHLHQ
jgi:hypothetical protein